jgi:hypothetical protein
MNIFDLENKDDLPEYILKDLNSDKIGKRLIELFEIANRDLSLDEVTVGYYRRFKDKKTKDQLNAKLYNMSLLKKPFFTSVKGRKGIYKLNK